MTQLIEKEMQLVALIADSAADKLDGMTDPRICGH